MAEAVVPPWSRSDAAIVEDPSTSTESSDLQQETADECLPLLMGRQRLIEVGADGLPKLDRENHAAFLKMFLGRLPSGFTGLDASRPWMLYWCTMGLSLLGEDLSTFSSSLADTLRPMQNFTGGFGGSHGQFSHTATTYASILSIATIGDTEGFDMIDRKAMWEWLGRLKRPSGEYEVTEGGENDVRGSFCAMVLASLLNLPTELPRDSPARLGGHSTLDSGLTEWISQCQTYEGGIGAVPNAEAHGAYTFCALACLCILGDPREIFFKHLDVPNLLRWLAQRQHAPEGGLAGRSNKLVDGCYSHWIGGCWALLEAAYRDSQSAPQLFNGDALVRYVLYCCQGERGGLRDKPSKPPDAYHTNYVLAGLSSAQYQYHYRPSTKARAPLMAALGWSHLTGVSEGSEGDAASTNCPVSTLHPVYVIPWGAAEKMRSYFETKPLDVGRPC